MGLNPFSSDVLSSLQEQNDNTFIDSNTFLQVYERLIMKGFTSDITSYLNIGINTQYFRFTILNLQDIEQYCN